MDGVQENYGFCFQCFAYIKILCESNASVSPLGVGGMNCSTILSENQSSIRVAVGDVRL